MYKPRHGLKSQCLANPSNPTNLETAETREGYEDTRAVDQPIPPSTPAKVEGTRILVSILTIYNWPAERSRARPSPHPAERIDVSRRGTTSYTYVVGPGRPDTVHNARPS